MKTGTSIPEILSPAGSLDAVRAAVANGADAVYLGASRFNARDEGAQLSLEELRTACALAHASGVRVYLTFNVLIKPGELEDALLYLEECVEAGIDAVIVQDLGVVRLVRSLHPGLEIHGSTQMTVHDPSGARVLRGLGVHRVVLARENTLEDIRTIRSEVPDLPLETFVHGALCISYSGQCFMSGMISERSANRGSCAQSCRKDYVLRDDRDGSELDRGYLISAKDLAAHDHLAEITRLGIGCLKIEGRKKKPEYVAMVTKGYRNWLDAIALGEETPPPSAEVTPLVQIFSRGNTGGMYGGRQGREYVTRTQPDNRGVTVGRVLGRRGEELLLELDRPLATGDGLGFEHPAPGSAASMGGTVERSRSAGAGAGAGEAVQRILVSIRWAAGVRGRPGAGWRVVRTSDVGLLRDARGSFTGIALPAGTAEERVDLEVSGREGMPLRVLWRSGGAEVLVEGTIPLVPAGRQALDRARLTGQLGRLGGTGFVLGALDDAGLGAGLFLPVGELNRIRQEAVPLLAAATEEARGRAREERRTLVRAAVEVPPPALDGPPGSAESDGSFALRAVVHDLDGAREAADAGATEVVLDPFVRHPTPTPARVRALAESLGDRGIGFRLRTPVIVRPADRGRLDRWLDAGFPLLSGHLGLVGELAGEGRDVIADYGTNVFNGHTAGILFELGARRIVASIELALPELASLVAPWDGEGFEVLVHGRPEGMTIEHCVLSAAFDRVPTTCRDLCVRKHPEVSLTDPTGYTFAVATDSDCRNRLLHSRPVDGSEFLPALWKIGIRGFHAVFNVPGDPVGAVVAAWRRALDEMSRGGAPDPGQIRGLLEGKFTRGHFVRPV